MASYLVASEVIEFRALLRRVLKGADARADVKAAHSQKIMMSLLSERTFDLIVLDDVMGSESLVAPETARLITEKHACLLLKKGPRSSLRRRSSPFPHYELQLDNILDEAALSQAVASIGQGGAGRAQRGQGTDGSAVLERRMAMSANTAFTKVNPDVFRPDILILGSSTGGPEALEHFFSNLKFELAVPVVLVQHTPAGFTRYLVDRIQQKCGFEAAEAAQGMVLEWGKVVIAPGDYHVRLKVHGNVVRCELSQDAFINSVRPAVDPMFETAAEIYGNKVSALIFTGMGEDGARGCRAVKGAGGCVGIQSERTCVVYGMPGAVSREGLQDYEGSPQDLAATIDRQMSLNGARPRNFVRRDFVFSASSIDSGRNPIRQAESGQGADVSASDHHVRAGDLSQADSPLWAFARFIEERTGIQYTETNRYQLENRLQSIAHKQKFADIGALFQAFKSGSNPNLEKIILEEATNHETSFFRDGSLFQAFKELMLPKLIAFSRPVSIWSNACSSGQEAVSLAILCEEAGLQNYKIFCSDISDKILKKARSGVYSDHEVRRGLDSKRLSDFFVAGEEDGARVWTVHQRILTRMYYKRLNLLEPWSGLGTFDVIFMRNVLIYQSLENKKVVLRKIFQHLSPEGYFVLGASESLIGLSDDFVQQAHNGSLFFVPALAKSA